MTISFMICRHCGNIVYFVDSSGMTPTCCGDKMTLLTPADSDGAVEKHVPAVITNGKRIRIEVGSTSHPMEEKHYIKWIALETDKGIQFKYLNPGEAPAAEFVLSDGEEAKTAFEYCSIHGLWMADV